MGQVNEDAIELCVITTIKLDPIGEICYTLAKALYTNGLLNAKFREILEDAITKKDKTGLFCYLFAKDIKGANIQKLQQVIIDKDLNGQICYLFARDVKGADIQSLKKAIIEKDTTGDVCAKFTQLFAQYGFEKDAKELEDIVIEKDKINNAALLSLNRS